MQRSTLSLSVATAVAFSTFAFSIEPPKTGCIDVLAGRARVQQWVADCAFPPTTDADVLRRVLQAVTEAKAAGENPVVVFDLDSTLYSTGPRALAALRMVLEKHSELFSDDARRRIEGIQQFTWFSVPDAFEDIGLSMMAEANIALWKKVAPFWFTYYRLAETVALDTLFEGAADYVRKVHEAGATIAYVTGRQKALMEESTVANLLRDRLPFGAAARGHLFLKTPEFREDILFKASTVAKVKELGTVVATFDNEPGNVVVFADGFPTAINVFVDTVMSDKPQPARQGLWRIRHWN